MVAVSLVPLTFLCRYRSDLLSPVTQEKTWWKHFVFSDSKPRLTPKATQYYQQNRQNLNPTSSARQAVII